MKKIISAIMAILFLVNIAGCSKSSSTSQKSDKKVVLKMWAHQNEPWNNAYKDIIANFEKENPNIRVELETFPYNDFESKVQTSLINKEGGADIYELWGGWALDFAPTGALKEIPKEFAEKVKKECYPATYGALVHKNKLYAVPIEFNIENGGMVVNLHLLKEAGLKVPKTWEELKQTAIKGTRKDGNKFKVKGFDFVNWDSVSYYFLSFILQQKGAYINEDGTAFNFETAEAKKSFAELAKLVKEDKVTNLEGLTGGGNLEGYQQLYAKRAMMVPRGPWIVSEGIQSFNLKLGKDFDYVGVPWYTNQHRFAAETGWSLAINAKSKEAAAAQKFIEYVYQPKVMEKLNIRCTQIPAQKEISQSASYQKEMPYTKVLLDILDNSQFIGRFNTDRLKEVVNDTFVKYCSNEYKTIEEALKELNKKANAFLKKK
ncbi:MULTISPECIES: extracellular solute-binding protein [Terrabacteria group]|uniref:extracellular solute-binding protein n=1 Tax=Bacillati TaxID=1783272 RepID=UPI001C6F13F3|nr:MULTISPECIES: extracellular solute-binding protein [Terrabacteria group]MBW9212179.1 extracellular solute-binding protein [Trueperella sp. zg.1013]